MKFLSRFLVIAIFAGCSHSQLRTPNSAETIDSGSFEIGVDAMITADASPGFSLVNNTNKEKTIYKTCKTKLMSGEKIKCQIYGKIPPLSVYTLNPNDGLIVSQVPDDKYTIYILKSMRAKDSTYTLQCSTHKGIDASYVVTPNQINSCLGHLGLSIKNRPINIQPIKYEPAPEPSSAPVNI